MSVFENFEKGKWYLSGEQPAELNLIPWSPHPKFEGVELKHLITAKDTGGAFSYHLVRVAPQKKLEAHIHATQLETHEIIAGKGICSTDNRKMNYEPGVIAILPKGIEHEVSAGNEGLCIFAKFFPALC